MARTTVSPSERGSTADTPDGSHEGQGTRERILDIALDLFIEKGFDRTSLREIAAELGYSKAAVYYHFASKEEILLALHLRLHEIGHETLDRLGLQANDPESWAELMERLVTDILADRKLFALHERNRAALERLPPHDSGQDDLEGRIRRVLADPTVPARDRVRLGCTLGAVMGGLMLSGDALPDVSSEEFGEMLREAVRDLLVPRSD